jgi:hypothetical protein
MQAAEAKKHATNFNATVGMAVNEGEPLILPTIQDNLPRLSPSEAVAYAPTPGDPRLRGTSGKKGSSAKTLRWIRIISAGPSWYPA